MKPGRSPAEPRPHSLASPYVLAAVVLAIAYASLYPFDLSLERWLDAIRAGSPLRLRISGRGDFVANLLFYVPLGLAIAARARHARSSVVTTLAAALAGAALSCSLECLQLASATRSASLIDIVLNTISAAMGALLGADRLRSILPMPGIPWQGARGTRAVVLCLALWFIWHAAPFVPQLSRSGWIDALRPALALDFEVGGIAKYVGAYLILGTVLHVALQRRVAMLAFLGLVALSWASRIVFVDQSLSTSEPVGAIVATALLALLRGTSTPRLATIAFSVGIGTLFLHGLDPFDFSGLVKPFQWLPFRGVMNRDLAGVLTGIAERTFIFSTLLYLAWLTPLGLRAATGFLVACVGSIELLQCLLPSRGPEITDILLAAACGAAVGLLVEERQDAPKPDDALPRRATIDAVRPGARSRRTG